MYQLTDMSARRYRLLHPKLKLIIDDVLAVRSIGITCSIRSRRDQEQAFNLKRSKAHFGQSPHNYFPALAFDFIPMPFKEADWSNSKRFAEVAADIKDIAAKLKVTIHWGGDWETFKDYPHIELYHWRDLIDREAHLVRDTENEY